MMLRLELLIWLLCLCWRPSLNQEWEPTSLSGDHVCHYAENEEKQINTTYLQPAQVKNYYFCLRHITLKCAEYKTVMEQRWKLENISSIVMKTSCCAGYKEYSDTCVPACTSPCINGECTEPETCSCASGFSGKTCEKVGCDEGRWGPDCGNQCACQHGGFCHPVHGGCSCTPGYHGVRCQDQCPKGFFGAGCKEDCSCEPGTVCNHVTGDCVPCQPGFFGEGCTDKCDCAEEGTELCSAKDGKCFCKENRFGVKCELLCPFGYINHTCFSSPINQDSCQCSNHLFTCDLELGCVCPPGIDCGLQQKHEVLEVAPLSDDNSGSSGGDNATTIAAVSLLIIVVVAVILIVVYYRRRMKVLKTDLENRSVRYAENPSYLVGQSADLVVHDNLGQEDQVYRPEGGVQQYSTVVQPRPAQSLYPGVPVVKNTVQHSGDFLNNQLSLASQQPAPTSSCQPEVREKKSKNTNIDNFKLGVHDNKLAGEETGTGCSGGLRVNLPESCSESTRQGCSEDYSEGACGGGNDQLTTCGSQLTTCDQLIDPVSVIGEGSGVLPDDVNVLRQEVENEKAMKPSLSLTFKNNIARSSELSSTKPETENPDEEMMCRKQNNNGK